jgi:hypothetical protein
MNEETRRAIAYVAGRIQTGKKSSSVYDYSAGKYSNFSGDISETRVAVFDFDAGAHISGTGRSGQYSLFHYGASGHISLKIESGGRFSGFDYSSSSHFSGTVSGQNVTLYDYGSGNYFNYSI